MIPPELETDAQGYKAHWTHLSPPNSEIAYRRYGKLLVTPRSTSFRWNLIFQANE